jgi:Response regulators consisting of a CheY-like receiver domain and a winged-helix DNA-binding domain
MKLTMFEEMLYNRLTTSTGTVVTRSELYSTLYPNSIMPRSNSIEVLIGRLRKKLPEGTTIKAKRGVGYTCFTVVKENEQ